MGTIATILQWMILALAIYLLIVFGAIVVVHVRGKNPCPYYDDGKHRYHKAAYDHTRKVCHCGAER